MQNFFFSRILAMIGGSFRVLYFFLAIVAGICIVSTATFLGIYFFFARDLPDIDTLKNYDPPVISEVFASDGTKIGEFWNECRIFVSFDDIPKRVVQAFVDSEDSRFFEHKGVDIRSIVRAFIANMQAGSITQGGSTITQQVTRALLLSREKSIERKVREAILATRIERDLSKKEILTIYLNQIYLGNRAYGVAAAARNYFKKDLKDLNLAEISLIAGLPTAPTNFSPINNALEARKRQTHVLMRMVEEGHISAKEAHAAEIEPLKIYVAGIDKDFTNKDAAYFTEHVRRIIKEKYGDEVLYQKGLKIYTTVDLRLQKAALDAVKRGIELMDKRLGYRGAIETIPVGEIEARAAKIERELAIKQNGGVIYWPPQKKVDLPQVILNKGEEYKAIVTGFNGKETDILIGRTHGVIKLDGLKWARKYSQGSVGYEGANYVNDPKSVLKVGDLILVRMQDDGSYSLFQDPVIQSALFSEDPHTGFIKAMVGGYDFAKSEFNRVNQALRQPGSSYKPFVYSSALDKGYTFSTVIVDGPVSFHLGRNEFWSPKNYGGNYNGPMTFRNCIQFSRNIPTAKITYDIGTHYLTAFTRKLGITSPIEKYLSMALGANAVYLQEMVQAYSTFVNDGILKPVVAITKITDSRGHEIESVELQKMGDLAPAVADSGDAVSESEKKAKEIREKLKNLKESQEVDESDLNTELFEAAKKVIEKDKLNLTDLELRTLYGAQIPHGHVITPQTAYLMVLLLRGVVEGGTGTRVKLLGRPAAGKTGTTNDETDAWFIGFTPDYAAGVWIGFDELQQIGRGVTGGTSAAVVFTDYMKAAHEGLEIHDFVKPAGMEGDIENMPGGSSLFGFAPKTSIPGAYTPGSGGGRDKADDFFNNEDL